MTPLSEIYGVADEAARAGARVLLDYFGRATVHEKSTQNLVTQADLESERVIAEIIHARFPGHTLMQEETEFRGDLGAADLWVVDPLDATNNYAHGIPHFCVSVAYVRRGELQVGMVYDPLRDEMFSAMRGSGAQLNGNPIHVAQPSGLNRSIIATGFYYDRGYLIDKTLASIGRLFRANIRGIRRMGAAALDLAWVGCGRYQAFFEYHLAPWDYAAGALIVQEAGGQCWDRAGRPLTLDSRSIIATCPEIAVELSELVAWTEADERT